MAETITLDDIRNFPNLREMGVQPGDTYTIGSDGNPEITRVFSKESDRVDLGYRITDQDIIDYPNLQQIGAKPGDRFVNGEVIPTESDDFYTQFMYGYDKQNNFTGYLSDIAERYFPLGRFSFDFKSGFDYVSPEEAYGKGFTEADVDTRRDMILRARERALLEEYGPYFEPQGGFAQGAGEVAGVLADPTTLIPVGAGIKAGIATGAALGGTFSVVEDLALKGEIDLEKAAIYTGAGAAGGAIFPAARALLGKSAVRSANRRISQVEKTANEHIAAGGSPSEAIDIALSSPAARNLQKDIALSGRKPNIAVSSTRAQQILQANITNDSAVSRVYSKTLDKYLGNLSTRVGNISQPVLRRLREFEYNIHTKTFNRLKNVEPFMKQLSSLPRSTKDIVARHLFNGEFSAAEAYMDKEMRNNFRVVQNDLKKFHTELMDSGYDFPAVDNYFPRLIKDYDGFLKTIGSEKKNKISQALAEYAKAKKIPVASIDADTKSNIANLVIRGYGVKAEGTLPRFVKPRKVETVSEDILKHYASPEEALNMYIRNATNNIERRNFLGRAFTKNASGSVDLDTSIGRVVQEELDAGRIANDKVDELVDLLKSRFIGGEQSPGGATGFIRDLGYMGTIANPISAITQLGDLGVSGALNGFRNTIASMFGAKNIKVVDLGLDRVGQEFSDVRKTAKILNSLFKLSGFARIDRLGKETYINAAIRRNVNMLKSAKGEKAFRQKWSRFYGDDIEPIIADLKSGKVTESVKFHAFNELSEVQPITMSELPQAYLDNPNGRLLYALKSFTLKQYDIVRRNVVQEWKRGNKLNATKNAAALAGYLTAAQVGTQTTKDILLGRDVRAEDLPDNAMWALLGVFGVNKYVSDKYLSKGEFTDAAIETLAPATPIIDAVFKLPVEAMKDDPNYEQYLRSVPLVGPMLYNWFGGGAEKYNERLEKGR